MLAVLLGFRKSSVRFLVTTASALTVASGVGYFHQAFLRRKNATNATNATSRNAPHMGR
jgi:hypothetical protein